MVNSMHLKELLEIQDITERNKLLRRAFSAYTETIDITGCEEFALIILLNLTYRRNQVEDLLDKVLAKKTLNNEDYIGKCINEVEWFHTHNLKYPDIRVSKQTLAVNPPPLHPHVLSSANYDKIFGWSHDSAKVNVVKLFLSYFKWQDDSYCVAQILVSLPDDWKAAFTSLGMKVKVLLNLCGRVSSVLPEEVIPSFVDRYCRQIRMPYHDGYTAITPVISHSIQSKIQQAAIQKKGSFTKVEFTRPAAVSELVASIGGFVNALSYPPDVGKSHHGLSQSRLFQIQNGKQIFNGNVLLKPQFIGALEGIIFNHSALALKQRRQLRVKSIKELRNTLSEWFAPILEWRLDIIENRVNLIDFESINDQLEYKLVSTSDDELPSLVIPLFGSLNSMLANIPMMQKYAFHPKLMEPLKFALKWLLSNISNEEHATIKDDDLPFRYLHLSGIRVFDAQALSNPYCSGIPSLTAVWGMLHHYQRNLNQALGLGVRFTSFSWFIRDYSLVSGKKLPEINLHGTKPNDVKRPGIVDNQYCDLTFDLVVHIDGYQDELLKLDDEPELLKAHFPSNFAGGVMHQPELDSNIDWCRLYHKEKFLFEKIQRLPLSGCWVIPTEYKVNDFESLFAILNNDSKLSPSMMGYILLNKPEPRPGSLEKMHCYAEPVIGVVEYSSAINIRLKGKRNYFHKAFWMLDAQEKFMLMKKI